jgi:hypothetical protein
MLGKTIRITLSKLRVDQAGRALVLVLILLVVGGIITLSLLSFMGTGLKAGQVHDRKTAELYAADSGVEDALWQIQANAAELPKEGDPVWSYNMGPVNDKNVDVAIEHIETRIAEITYDTYRVTSTASASGSETSIESHVEISRTPFGAAITVTDGGVKLENCNVTGSLWANGEVELESSTVTGEIRENYYPDGGYPELDITWYIEQAKGPGDIYVHDGDVILGAGNHVLGPAYIDGYLKIEENATVELNGIIYVTGETLTEGRAIHIESGATITGSGTEDQIALIAEQGNIKIELCTFDVEPMPLVWAVSGDIERIEENQFITAMLYAPQGEVKFEENVEICGAVFASTLGTCENTLCIYPSPGDSMLTNALTIHTWEIH